MLDRLYLALGPCCVVMVSALKPAPQWSPVSQQWRVALPRVQQDTAFFPYRSVGIFTDWFNFFYQGKVSGSERDSRTEMGERGGKREGRKEKKNRLLWSAGCIQSKTGDLWAKLGAWNITVGYVTLIFVKLGLCEFHNNQEFSPPHLFSISPSLSLRLFGLMPVFLRVFEVSVQLAEAWCSVWRGATQWWAVHGECHSLCWICTVYWSFNLGAHLFIGIQMNICMELCLDAVVSAAP